MPDEPQSQENSIANPRGPAESHNRTSSQISFEQPDQDPVVTHNPINIPTPVITAHKIIPKYPEINCPEVRQPHEIPVPDDAAEELMCDLLTWIDDHAMDVIGPDDQNLVWKAGLEFTKQQLTEFCKTSHNPSEEQFLMLATATKKQRTEVKLSNLEPEERREFEAAKSKEVNNWLQTGTVMRMFRNELSPKQILRCRWLCVWKPIECPKEQKENGGKSRKAKARLVVLGCMDPQLDTIPRDSPTLGRTSKMLIAQVIASMHWSLMSFDIEAAFLQGKTQEDRVIAIEPTPEMVSAMN